MNKIKSYGKVAITINGEFNPDKSYDRLCIVEYNGLDYISIIDNTTQPPTDKTQWKLLSRKGDKGDKGDPGINGINGKDGKDGQDGDTGPTGIPGVAFEVRYCLGTENSYDGDSNPDGSSPTGWLTFIPNVTEDKPYIWCIQGRKVYINQTDYNISWNAPFKLSGTNGLNGTNGTDGLNGSDGINGKDGTSIVWKGDLTSHPSNPQNGWSYKNTIDKKSYIYQDGAWYQMTIDGVDGKDGKDGTSISIAGSLNSESELPIPPTNSSDCYIIGQDIYIWDGTSWYNGGQFKGDNGVSIIWKGRFNSHPSGPQAGWAYYNITEKKSYIYDGNEWDIMTYDGIDGVDGQDGKDGENGSDGLSIVWKGDLATPPENPQLNWCYRDTDNKKVYIYNGVAWELMVADGNDGVDGASGVDGSPGKDGENGQDGLSVFITYHDNPKGSVPNKPTGDGTTGGWHTNGTSAVNWMSQKVAATATSGEWSEPIRISPIDGEKGDKGDKAPIVYPAGIFDPSVVYTTDANKAPYVLDSSDGNYYVLTSIGSWVGNNQTEDKNTPSKDFLVNKGSCWNKFDGFEAIFAKIGIIANGLIGSAVFNGTYMFSQQGTTTLEGATITTDYENFNPENPFGENNVFYPNICFNFATGETWLGKNKFSINKRGIITIGGFEISNNGMTYFDEENNTLLRVDRNLGFQIANAYNGLPIAQISPTGKGVFSNRNINFLPDGSISIKTNNGKNVFVINSDGSGKIGETVIEWDESNVWIGNKSLSVLDDGAIIDNKTKFIDITNFLTNNVFISNVESVDLNVDVENYETIVLYSTRYFSSNIIYYASTINVILNNISGKVDNRKINILVNGFTSKSINTYIKFNNIYQYLFGKGPNGTNTIGESFTTEYNIKKEYILKTAANFITNAPTTLFAILV